MKTKYLFWMVLLLTACQSAERMSLQEQFTSPSEQAKPWTFWYWMYGAVSPEGITADLESMKEVGLGGAYLMPIRGYDEAPQGSSSRYEYCSH